MPVIQASIYQAAHTQNSPITKSEQLRLQVPIKSLVLALVTNFS